MKVVNFDKNVFLAISECSDGNMMHPDFFVDNRAEIINKRQEFLRKSGVGLDNTVLIRVTYDRDSFTDYKLIDSVKGYQLEDNLENIQAQDGLMIDKPNVALFLPLADCLGIVLYDDKQKTLMVVHAGRHTLEQDGVTKAVDFLKENGSQPEDLSVWLSPSAGAENYPIHFFDGKSLEQVAREQLSKSRVKKVISAGIDTTTNENYFSHSQGDTEHRHAILAYMK